MAAAASTETNPNAASKRGLTPNNGAMAAPLVTPMKKMGVRMPPLPPDSSVTPVTIILTRKAMALTLNAPVNTPSIVSVPSPAYCTPLIAYTPTTIRPPSAAMIKGCASTRLTK